MLKPKIKDMANCKRGFSLEGILSPYFTLEMHKSEMLKIR